MPQTVPVPPSTPLVGANAGQTYLPFKDNIHVPTLPYEPLERPNPALPELELNQMARDRKWKITQQAQHFVPGVTVEMLDWFWGNMEKCYYLWAPGSHKRFSWLSEPWMAGFVNSAHLISEAVAEGAPVFGGSGIEICRMDLDMFPFTWALDHVIVEGTFNDLGEFVDMTVHMWDACEGGIRHVTSAVASTTVTEPPHFVKEMLAEDPYAELVAPSSTDHAEYEASRWPAFLPQLFEVWKGHPDPCQNYCPNLEVEQVGPERWHYTHENGPIVY
ncbi:MAG: hypothetical protein J6D54_09880 [Olsenella sp.]|nr:hypothetical protein [Olsenella sp.]